MTRQMKADGEVGSRGCELVELPCRAPASAGAERAVDLGDRVEWINASFIQDTRSRGEIVHVSGDHAVIFNSEVARRHPQISPYVTKRLNELQLVPAAVAA